MYLTWKQTRPDLWRSDDNRFTIHRTVLPEGPANLAQVFTLRKLHGPAPRSWPGYLGHPIGEYHDLGEAQTWAGYQASADAHPERANIPADYEAIAIEHFWPGSGVTAQTALAVCRDGDRTVARVVGMLRDGGGYRFHTWAEVDLTELLAAGQAADRRSEMPA